MRHDHATKHQSTGEGKPLDIVISRADLKRIGEALAAFVDNTSFDYDAVTRVTEGLKEARTMVDRLLLER